jgi:hypothetical protein
MTTVQTIKQNKILKWFGRYSTELIMFMMMVIFGLITIGMTPILEPSAEPLPTNLIVFSALCIMVMLFYVAFLLTGKLNTIINLLEAK